MGGPTEIDEVEAIKDIYREAGRSKNTHATYLQAVKHYRDICGNPLPATTKDVSDYIATQARNVKVSTLRVRLAGISKWHKSQGFFDPTSSAAVKELMKGIAKVHNEEQTQAYPLTFAHLRVLCDHLEAEKLLAIQREDQVSILRLHRDIAIILCGFWQGFRSDELSRIRVEDVKFHNDRMTIFIPYSKTDAGAAGRKCELPRLKLYCPVSAFRSWVQLAGIENGAAFRKIDRWGNISDRGINKRTVERVLQAPSEKLFPGERKFTTHSLRQGFADWAVDMDWSEKTIMDHVGWQSIQSARRYIPARRDFGDLAVAPPNRRIDAPDINHGDRPGLTLIATAREIDENK